MTKITIEELVIDIRDIYNKINAATVRLEKLEKGSDEVENNQNINIKRLDHQHVRLDDLESRAKTIDGGFDEEVDQLIGKTKGLEKRLSAIEQKKARIPIEVPNGSILQVTTPKVYAKKPDTDLFDVGLICLGLALTASVLFRIARSDD